MAATMLHLQLTPPTPPPTLIHHPTTAGTTAGTTANSGVLFRRKLLFLENHLHLDSSRLLSLNPSLRSTPLSSILGLLSFLSSSFYLSPADSSRLFHLHPSLISPDSLDDLLPVSAFLHSLFPRNPNPSVRLSVVRCPRLLLSSVPLQLSPSLLFLRRLGLRITPHTTLLLASSVERTLIPKLDFIQSLGFSYHETRKMAVRCPGLLTFSVERNFNPKVEFLVGEMGRDVRELKEFPQYFACSLERKIRPRHEVLKETGVNMSLKEMLKVSDGEFRERVMEKQFNIKV